MVLEAMTAALDQEPGIEIVDRARSFSSAATVVRSRAADVIVTDYQLGDGLGTDLVGLAQARNPPVPILLISGTDDKKAIEAALTAGCSGFVSKAQGFEQLVDAVIAVAGGAAVFPAILLSQTLGDERAGAETDLSPRELEILQLLAEGRSIAEISDQLHLSVHTIRNHVKQILTKLDAHSQLQAVVNGARRGLIHIR